MQSILRIKQNALHDRILPSTSLPSHPMKTALRLLGLLVLAAATACRAATAPARNTLPTHRALTETTVPENGEPSRPPRFDTLQTPPRELPVQPKN